METDFSYLVWSLFLACRRLPFHVSLHCREGGSSGASSYKASTLMSLFKPKYLPKTPSPNTTTLEIRTSKQDLVGAQFSSQHHSAVLEHFYKTWAYGTLHFSAQNLYSSLLICLELCGYSLCHRLHRCQTQNHFCQLLLLFHFRSATKLYSCSHFNHWCST